MPLRHHRRYEFSFRLPLLIGIRDSLGLKGRRVILFAVKRIPIDAVHIAPAANRCLFDGLDGERLQLRRVAVFFHDSKALGAVDFIRVNMFFKETNLAGTGFVTIVLVQCRNNFFTDIQELRLQADEHARQGCLPWSLIDQPPAPVLQALG